MMEDGPMVDRATPNFPSRDLDATARFYARLGFEEKFHDEGWMILHRGALELEFFPYPRLDPRVNTSRTAAYASPTPAPCTRRSRARAYPLRLARHLASARRST